MYSIEMASRKRPCTSDGDGDQFKVGTSIKLALGDLYQECVQLRSDVKELKEDVHNVLKNQGTLSQSLKHIEKLLVSNSKGQRSSEVKTKQQQQQADEGRSDSSEDNGLLNGDKEDDGLEYHFGLSEDRVCQTDPVTILPGDLVKTNVELRNDIKSVLQNQSTLSYNMRSIWDMLNKQDRTSVVLDDTHQAAFIEPDTLPDASPDLDGLPDAAMAAPSPASKYYPDVEEIKEVRPESVETHSDNNELPGTSAVPAGAIHIRSAAVEMFKQSSPVPIPQSLLSSGILKPVPKIIPGPYTGTFLVGGDSTLVRDIAEYESILMQIYTKKPLETDTEKARQMLRHLFRMVIPSEILATCNVTGKSRDAVTHRWIRVPKIDEALLLPIFNQARFQFPEFTDWYTDEKSRTVQYLNNVCKTVRHSSKSSLAH